MTTDKKTMFPLKSFYIAGVQFRPSDVIDPLLESNDKEKIRFTYEPENKFDPNNAIKIECLFLRDLEADDAPLHERPVNPQQTWEHIGYVPKSDTAIFHLLRRLSIPIHLRLDINPGAETHRCFLVSAAVEGDESLAFITAD